MVGIQACVTAVPQAIDALVAFAEAHLPEDVTVYDSDALEADPGDYVIIGIQDLESEEPANSAQTTQDWAAVGWQQSTYTDEAGVISCAAVACDGDGDLKAARDKVTTIVATLGGATFADPTLGLGPWFQARIGTFQLSQLSHDRGVTARAAFEVHITARLMRPA